jgi:hypothetical protein
MKSNPHSIAPRAWLPRSVAIATGLLAMMAPVLPVVAGTGDSLVITENSSTSLTATWDGASVPVANNSANNWSITLPVPVYIGFTGEGAGAFTPEPSGETGFNNVFDVGTTGLFGNVVTVASDVGTTTGTETQAADGVFTQVGADASGVPVFLSFHDVGDGGSTPTPDGGSTALLGVLSFLALFGVARLRAGSAPVR